MTALLAGLRTRRAVAAVAAVAVLAALVAAGALLLTGGGGGTTHLTAYFSRTIGLYQGNDVRILGVKVGRIDSLRVDGDHVVARLSVDDKYKIPADVRAVVVTPSVVSDRYVQLTPAYTGGPTLPDGARLGLDRTAVPLEFDEIFKNLDQLDRALGPHGANAHGALSRLVDVSAANLKGNGQQLNQALAEFSAAVSALSGSRTDLFSTVRHLQSFTTNLARKDGGIRALNANLARVGDVLATNRQELGTALANLSTALQLVDRFVADNRAHLTGDIRKATAVTNVLVREKDAIEQVIDLAPYALTNLALASDPRAHTLDTKDNAQQPLANPTAPDGTLCQLLPQLCSATKSGAGGTLSWQDLLAVKR